MEASLETGRTVVFKENVGRSEVVVVVDVVLD